MPPFDSAFNPLDEVFYARIDTVYSMAVSLFQTASVHAMRR